MTYRINGTSLDTPAWALSVDDGLQQTPEWVDRGLVLPGAHGEYDPHAAVGAPPRQAGPGQIKFTGWIKGVDRLTGQWLEPTSLATYFARVEDLLRLFRRRNLTIDHVLPDGTTRRAVGYRLGSIKPAREPGAPWFGRFEATVKLPGSFWTALDPVTIGPASAGVASGTQIPLGALAAGTAPVTDAVVVFGAGNNPSLVQDGSLFAWDGVIAAGRTLSVDTGARRCTAGPGAVWTPDDAAVRYGPGYASWFEIDPDGGPITLLHTGGGVMTCSITARPRWETS